jgi:hypothetical protein
MCYSSLNLFPLSIFFSHVFVKKKTSADSTRDLTQVRFPNTAERPETRDPMSANCVDQHGQYPAFSPHRAQKTNSRRNNLMEVSPMEKKVSWDAIPSLEGLEVDWEYNAGENKDKRACVRLNLKDMGAMFASSEITAKVATVHEVHSGLLVDISPEGAAVILPVSLEGGQPVKFGVALGSMRVIAKAQVRHVQPVGAGYKIGIRVVELEEQTRDFLGSLYASKVFRHNY